MQVEGNRGPPSHRRRDQLPEALLPLVVLADGLDLTGEAIIGTTLLFTVLDLIVATVWPTGSVSVRAQRNGSD